MGNLNKREFLTSGWLAILLGIAFMASSQHSIAETSYQYKTEEFRESGSTIPAVFLCGFLAEHYKFSPGAMSGVLYMMIEAGVTPEQFDAWSRDAVYFSAVTLDGRKPVHVWRERDCDIVIRNVRRSTDK